MTIFLKFIVRTVFVYCLGVEYLGVNGLFTNILSILNLTEMGFGASIVYNLYKYLAVGDKCEVSKYVNAFRKIYAVIGVLIFVLGMILTPFLHVFIKDTPNVGNIRFIYFLYLADSVSSYFFAHYRELLQADQKGYINYINRLFFVILQSLAQIIILVLLKNFYLYLSVNIVLQYLSGMKIRRKALKVYPFLKEKCKDKLSKEQKDELFRNSKALFYHMIGFAMLNSTDNIIISSFIGTVAVGKYSNYALIQSILTGLIALFTANIQATVGNVCAKENDEQQIAILMRVNFIIVLLYGIVLSGMYITANSFIEIWVGADYVLSENILFAFYINAFLLGIRSVISVYITALGLFYRTRTKPFFEVTINLIFSIVLVKRIGMTGVFAGTLISFVTTNLWYEPFVLFKCHYKKGLWQYYRNCAGYVLLVFICIFINRTICSFIHLTGIPNVVFRAVISIAIPILTFSFVYRNTSEYLYLKKLALQKVKNLFRKDEIISD